MPEPHVSPIRIDAPDGSLPGTWHGELGPAAVFLYPPGEERKGCVRPVFETARLLATSGRQALIFDYRGTGDAPGEFSEVSWEGLERDALAAADFAAVRSGGGVTLIAARLAARLTLDVARKRSQTTTRLVLWEPALDGTAWLRETQRRSSFRSGGRRVTGDIDGYLYGEALLAALEKLGPCPAPAGAPTRVISLNHREQPTRAAAAAAAELGAECAALRLPAFWLETDPFDCSALAQATLRALED